MMIRLAPDTHYKGKVHEYLYPVHGSCKNIYAVAYHSGYIFVTEEQRLAHFKRNEQLLREMIAEEPTRIRWRTQLLQEYRAVHDYENMYTEGMACLDVFRDVDNAIDNLDIGTFYAAAAEGKLFMREEDEAYQIGEMAIRDSRISRLSHAYIMLLDSVIFYNKSKWSEARCAINAYFRFNDYFKKHPEQLANERGALFVSESFDEIALIRIYLILIVCGLKQNDIKPLKMYWKELGWEKDSVYLMDGVIRALL